MSGLRWQSAVAVAAALVSCALGAGSLLESDRRLPHRPQWAPIVAPLVNAPIPANTVTALNAGPGTSPAQLVLLLREAAWQRPDLRWAPASELPASLAPAALVTIDDGAPPVGWRQVWRAGRLRLWVPNRP